MINKKENFLKVSLQSFSAVSLAKAIGTIREYVKTNFGTVIGPLMLPVKRRSFSIRRSPHIYARSRETISMAAHKRVLYIMFDDAEKTINLENYITADILLKVSFSKLSYKRPDRKTALKPRDPGKNQNISVQEKDFFKNINVMTKNTRTSRGNNI